MFDGCLGDVWGVFECTGGSGRVWVSGYSQPFTGQRSEGSVLGGKPTGGSLFAGGHRSLSRRVLVAAGTVGPVAVKEYLDARIVGVGEGVTAMKRVPPPVGVAGEPHFPEPARFRFGAGLYVLVVVERSPGPARGLPAHRSHVRTHKVVNGRSWSLSASDACPRAAVSNCQSRAAHAAWVESVLLPEDGNPAWAGGTKHCPPR